MNKNDAVETMGKILPDEIPVGTRDAVHVAVLAAIAGMPLRAGDHVSYDKGKANGNQRYSKYIGIVDPFLEGTVKTGQTFWLFLYPRTVTGLKHVWEHPDVAGVEDDELPAPAKKTRSEADVTATRADAVEYLHQWAGNHGVEYTSMMRKIKECINDKGELDDYIDLGTGSSEKIDDPEEFWTNVGLVLNVDIKKQNPNYLFHLFLLKDLIMVLPDWMIEKLAFITPMAPGEQRQGVISYGLTSYGYDARVGPKNLKVFSGINAREIDPKEFDPALLVEPKIYNKGKGDFFWIPPHGFALCETVEEFDIPREYVCIVLGKSTYARCFSGDTKVKLVDGTSPTLKEMSDDYLLSVKSFYGFGFDTNKNKYVAQKLVAPRKIGKEKVLIINLDNNKEIKCTPDHIFYLRSGKTKRADQLKNGDSLLPLYTGLAQGYERVWDPFNRKFLPVSHMVDSMLIRKGKRNKRNENDHIHHKDGNRRNNNPKNLERITASEHAKLHNEGKDLSQQSKKYWADPINKSNHLKKLHTSKIFKKAGESRKQFYSTEIGKKVSKKAKKKMWETRGKEGRMKQAEVVRNLNLRSDITEKTVTQALLETGTIRGASKLLKVDRSAFRRFPELIKAFKEKRLQNNHKIVTISKLSETEEDIYCLTATETGNFALDAGVIVSNCGLIVNVTPGEPEWKGIWTVELSNTTELPIRVYLNEGIMQCMFFKGEACCRTSYKDKKGKYQDQSGVTLPKVINLDPAFIHNDLNFQVRPIGEPNAIELVKDLTNKLDQGQKEFNSELNKILTDQNSTDFQKVQALKDFAVSLARKVKFDEAPITVVKLSGKNMSEVEKAASWNEYQAAIKKEKEAK